MKAPLLLRTTDYIIAFAACLAATLALVPLVRNFNRRKGIVDNPDPRRINKSPIPRGGGVGLIIGILIPYTILLFVTGRQGMFAPGITGCIYWKVSLLACAIGILGYVDDIVSLRPRVKLLGQFVIAALAWYWAGLGFHRLWPSIPQWLDCPLTMLWIASAVNAFNLIDGLDGLATGLALIATTGMGLSLVISGQAQSTLFHCAFAGGLVGFLFYNYNPASVFLGDSGSMFIGFTIAVLPLVFQTPDSFAVSVGVPLLAMGVPAFDTFLAIVRRTIRGLAARRSASHEDAAEVMKADSDHIHHRILRAMGFNQRKATLVLYTVAVAAVAVALCSMTLESRSEGLWLLAFAVAVVLIFKDMSMVEFFDATNLLNSIARSRDNPLRRLKAALSTPLWIFSDLATLSGAFLLCAWAVKFNIGVNALKSVMPVWVFAIFFALVVVSSYRTAWSRATSQNYASLFAACMLGTTVAAAIIYYTPLKSPHMKAFALAYAGTSFAGLAAMRCLRPLARDFFYSLVRARLGQRRDVSRILVYGGGIRYNAFRRELVRSASATDRIIVGILDDDILLRGRLVGDVRVLGPLSHVEAAVNETNADTVVIACVISQRRLEVVKAMLAPLKVKIILFSISETEIET